MPPPCAAVAGSGQVSIPGSPAPGVAFHRHCRSPVSGLQGDEEALHVHGVAADPDDQVLTTSGAVVVKYCLRASAICLRHRSWPVPASSAITQSSGPMK